MNLYYVDTSAVVKLLIEEPRSMAFAAFYRQHSEDSWVSSALLRVELVRAVRRTLPALLPDARQQLTAFDYLAIDEEIIEAAAHQPEPALRSLDAIHVATAQALEPDLTAMITYDDRLAQAAGRVGLSVVSPSD